MSVECEQYVSLQPKKNSLRKCAGANGAPGKGNSLCRGEEAQRNDFALG